MSELEFQSNITTKDLSTFKIGGTTKYFVSIKSKEDIIKAVKFAKENNFKIYILGGGSNTIFTNKEFKGIILKIEILGFEVLSPSKLSLRGTKQPQYPKDSIVNIKVGSGEIWDHIVEKTVDMGLVGFEHMSLIPGTVGAAPIQNVEAYRQETSESLVEVEAYDLKTDQFVILKNADCGFGYRTSIFKTTEKGRYIVVSVSYELKDTKGETIKIDKEIEKYFTEHNITNPILKDIRNAVIDIRNTKLYDPKKIPNCGSFFENVIIDKEKLLKLQKDFPDIFYFELSNGTIKIPTGWLIHHSGIDGREDTRGFEYKNLKISEKHALTLINPEGKGDFQSLLELIEIIVKAVKEKFDIDIEPEPNLVT